MKLFGNEVRSVGIGSLKSGAIAINLSSVAGRVYITRTEIETQRET